MAQIEGTPFYLNVKYGLQISRNDVNPMPGRYFKILEVTEDKHHDPDFRELIMKIEYKRKAEELPVVLVGASLSIINQEYILFYETPPDIIDPERRILIGNHLAIPVPLPDGGRRRNRKSSKKTGRNRKSSKKTGKTRGRYFRRN